ncbi:GNAT family N-acetyltransferase [Inhella sp.]|uniref:GNAT family N-acetyltransferase n=1 Tax=Inhella sp. TaxID=1921806 RepID=UPI0035ADCD58
MIRIYQPADCDDVLRVWAHASALAHPFLSEEFLELERHHIPNVYLPNADTWVWVTDGRVVGFISLLGNEVGAIFVEPTLQRSGIGRALMAQAKALRGELEVEVFESNQLGRAFYAKLGFELLHKRIHDQTGFEVMRLRLAADAPLQPADLLATKLDFMLCALQQAPGG